MTTTKLYLDLRSKAKDGKGTVLIMIIHNRTSASISTGIRLSPDDWDGKKIKLSSTYSALNIKLIEQKSKIDKDIALLSLDNKFDILTAAQLKAKIQGDVCSNKGGHLISDIFEEYMSKPMKDGTKEVYKAALAKVIAFAGESAKIENINTKWLYGLEKFMATSQGPNGRAIYFRCIRAVCNYAFKTHIVSVYPFDGFKFKTEPTRKRSVSVELFRAFLKHPTDIGKDKYRDYFLLSFLLIGINIKDLLLARHSQNVNGRLEYIRNKTHKNYSIKIEPEAQVLLDKYRGKDYLLEAMDHCKHHKSFARAINEACQKIGPVVKRQDEIFGEERDEIEPVIPGITTYFARHSWATFAYQIGIPIDVISQALGHSMNNKTTMIYIRYDQSKVDNANRLVIDWVFHNRLP